jgi:membrane protease YdiL (CAAX protease family)
VIRGAFADRDNATGWVVASLTLFLLVVFGAEGDAQWPWLSFNVLAAVPFLLLLIPTVQAWARARVIAVPALTIHVPMGLALFGMVGAVLSGSHNWVNFILWPVCVGVGTAALGRGESETPPARLLLVALALAVLAGIWERGVQIRVPGGTHLSLAFLIAMDLALFQLVVVRPLRTFDVRLALTARELGVAFGAVAMLAAIAIPLGFAVGFLSFQSRWLGAVQGMLRLFGLTLFVGLPEEMLFRGAIQEAFSRIWSPRIGLALGSVVFGLLHLLKHPTHPNWGYGLLATAAGLAYGWVYQRTGKLAAAAVTHGAVDWIWSMFLGA